MLKQGINAAEIMNTGFGQLQLTFEYLRERTRLIDCYQTPPLKASRALYVDGNHKATVYVMESSGGMVAGDHNEFKIHVKEGGAVRLKPQSATKIYPSFNDKFSCQNISIFLAEKAELEWNRDELIPYKDAKFKGVNFIQMHSTSTLIWGEIVYPGRERSGEQFQFKEFKTKLEIRVDDHCIVYDSLQLKPNIQSLREIGVLKHYNYIGSVWFISPKVKRMNEIQVVQQLMQTAEHQSGVSRLNGNGMMIRWLSNNLPLLKKEMESVFAMINSDEFFTEEL